MYAFDTHIWIGGDGSVVAGQQRQERKLELRAERRPLRKRTIAFLKRLVTTRGRRTEETPC